MITVSDAYKAEMKKTIRDYCEYVIRWYMCNADLQMANYQVGTNMHNLLDNTFIPKVTKLLDIRSNRHYLVTFEKNRWSTSIVSERELYNGIPTSYACEAISDTLSKEDCTFDTNPFYTITNVEGYIYGLNIMFDVTGETYPTEFTIAYTSVANGSKTITVTSNDTYNYFTLIDDTITGDLTITITKWSAPYTYARIGMILFGKMYKINNDNRDADNTLEHEKFLAPMTTELSYNKASFTMINIAGDFNVLNPTGMWKQLSPMQPVEIEYRQWIGDTYESFKTDWLYTTDEFTATSTGLKINATDMLSSINSTNSIYEDDLSVLNVFRERDYHEILHSALTQISDYIGITGDSSLYDSKGYMIAPRETNPTNILQAILNSQCMIWHVEENTIYVEDGVIPRYVYKCCQRNGDIISLVDSQLLNEYLGDYYYNDLLANTSNSGYRVVSLEKDRWSTANNTELLLFDENDMPNDCFVSHNLSDSSGNMAYYDSDNHLQIRAPYITVTPSKKTTIDNIHIIFDKVSDLYATSMSIDIINNGEIVYSNDVTNNGADFELDITEVTYTKMSITFNSINKPYNYLVVSSINGLQSDVHLTSDDLYSQPLIASPTGIKSITVYYYTYSESGSDTEASGDLSCTTSGSTNTFTFTSSDAYSRGVIGYDDEGTDSSGNTFTYFKQVASATTSTPYSKTFVLGTLATDASNYKVYARKINKVQYSYTLECNSFGEKKTFDNPFIISEAQAEKVAKWLYMYNQSSNTLTIDYRGNPEIECGDTVYVDTQFGDYMPIRVIDTKITAGGSIKGTLKGIKEVVK